MVFPARSALFNHNILNTKAISHFQANHILIRFVFPPLGDSENKNTYVWVVKDNRVSRREVTVYSPTGEANILISKGLKPDETVVIAGVYQLVEGQRVKEVE